MSVTGSPSSTFGPAVVDKSGVTGSTSKHSPALASVESGTPLVADVKTPRQQYSPTDVRCAGSDTVGLGLVSSRSWLEISVPPVSHRPSSGPQR